MSVKLRAFTVEQPVIAIAPAGPDGPLAAHKGDIVMIVVAKSYEAAAKVIQRLGEEEGANR